MGKHFGGMWDHMCTYVHMCGLFLYNLFVLVCACARVCIHVCELVCMCTHVCLGLVCASCCTHLNHYCSNR